MPVPAERWPPVYDADDLVREIKRLTARDNLEASFFEWRRDRSTNVPGDVCQGDVVALACDVPLIGESGEAEAMEHPGGHWLVIGNSCDFERSLDEAQWTQLVPLLDVGTATELSTAERDALRRYTQARRFYMPPWAREVESLAHVADLTRPVAIDKRAFGNGSAEVEARMSRAAWILLNACLVRFLARDDGRYA
jgi:hypothetical protein